MRGNVTMTTLPITLTMAGAAALINVWLGIRVSRLRRQHKVSIGHGGKTQLATRTRAHANFVEYTPFFLVLVAVIELAQGSGTWLWAASILFILGRLAHPFGMDRPGAFLLRAAGIVITWLVLVGLAAYALSIPYLEKSQPQPVTFASSVSAGASLG